MPKPVIEENEDGSIAVDLSVKPTRKFKGSDADPTDAETGESVFDDISPRFSRRLDEAAAASEETEDEDNTDEEAEETAADEEEVELEEETADEDDTTTDESEGDDVDEDPAPRRKERKDAFSKRLERSDRLLAEQRAETAALRERLNKQEAEQKAAANEQNYAAQKTDLTAKIAKARQDMTDAIEKGETAQQVEAADTLADLKGDLKVLEARYANAKLAAENSKNQRSGSEIVKTKSAQWVRKHGRFNTDPSFKATAQSVDAQVAAAGFDPESDEYYKEIDKRMAKFYPKEFQLARKTNETPPARKKPPVSGSRNDNAGKKPVKTSGPFKVQNGKVILSARNLQTMRDFGMDPTNPNDVRDFVQQNR
jgi:hypothetical protein